MTALETATPPADPALDEYSSLLGPSLLPRQGSDDLPSSLQGAKWAYTTRHVPRSAPTGITRQATPRAGDLVLARVRRVRQHKRLEDAHGRRQTLFVGDLIVVVCADRYAPDQFEAVVPDSVDEIVDLVAGGGVAARMRERRADLKRPTELEPIGLLTTDESVINVGDHAPLRPAARQVEVPVIGVVGASMNSGKTTIAAAITRGLSSAGISVGTVKLTGTGSGGDRWLFVDSGADVALDFTDCGLTSTYRAPLDTIVHTAQTVIQACLPVEIVVAEIADGLLQTETADLLRDPRVRGFLSGVVFAAPDPLAAISGAAELRDLGHRVLAVGGVLTRSPLARRETMTRIAHPVFDTEAFASPAGAIEIAGAALVGA
ncbi:MAG TPA: DUF1611 domain-containing protein [Acidimicrobiales bacterium]|nr:DUF1611 domain-containing protein [Acidimicrobiales bacterium]